MCGIAGFLCLTKRPDRPFAVLNTMGHQLRFRGPDSHGSWMGKDSLVGMTHRRLSIIDLSHASDQPMTVPDESLHIVFNGEIYNYQELREELQALGHVFCTTGDTEVLLHMYRQYGLEMLPRLRGMYAFAIYDIRTKTLVMARDPLGIKPLYYCTVDGTLYFASQVKSLQTVLRSDIPDPAGRAGFLIWGSLPEPYTFFRDIRAVPSGSAMVIDAHRVPTIIRGESVSDLMGAAAEQQIPIDRGEQLQVLREALLDSLRAHLTADVPVALFLSAGLDSSTLAALLSENTETQPATLTLGFNGKNVIDETEQAARIAAFYGLPNQQRRYGAEEFARYYATILEAMDQPSVDGINVFMITRMAKECGFKVALSGIGGDELFGGYPSFRQIPKMQRNFGWAGAVPALGSTLRVLGLPIVSRITSPKYAGLFEYSSSVQGAYMLRRSLFMPWELKDVMDPAMAREGLQQLKQRGLDGLSLPENLQTADPVRASVHILEMTMYMRNQLLRDTDWAGMANSVEVRVPLADWKLLKTLAPYIVRGCFSKRDMAATPARALPAYILNRPKTGFAVPVRDWMSAGIAGNKPKRGLRSWALHLEQVFSGVGERRATYNQVHETHSAHAQSAPFL